MTVSTLIENRLSIFFKATLICLMLAASSIAIGSTLNSNSSASSKSSDKGPIIRVYTAPIGEHNAPSWNKRKEFQCSEQIFTVVELSEHPQGKHHLSVKWIDPSKQARENTEYFFNVGESGTTKLWAWLELEAASGSALVAWMNPAAGLEEFVGGWEVEVRIDNRLVAKRVFDVSC